MGESWWRQQAAEAREKNHYKIFHDGNPDDPYMIRYGLHKGRFHSRYLHRICRSDRSPDFHDHPWPFFHMILEGCYLEEYLDGTSRLREPGSFSFRRANFAHRLSLEFDITANKFKEVWTYVIVGRPTRPWGFLDRTTKCWTYWADYIRGERC